MFLNSANHSSKLIKPKEEVRSTNDNLDLRLPSEAKESLMGLSP